MRMHGFICLWFCAADCVAAQDIKGALWFCSCPSPSQETCPVALLSLPAEFMPPPPSRHATVLFLLQTRCRQSGSGPCPRTVKSPDCEHRRWKLFMPSSAPSWPATALCKQVRGQARQQGAALFLRCGSLQKLPCNARGNTHFVAVGLL
jgi:hypothetical protein